MPEPLRDVVIVGAGIVGAAIAHELSRHRLAVTLLEREVEAGFGTSKANSGIVHGGHHTDTSTVKGRLEWRGNRLWDDWCAELGFGFSRIGEVTVALAEDELPVLDRLLANAAAKGIDGLERWDGTRLREAEPNLSDRALAAVFSPHTAVVNPYEAVFGLVESAVANGVELRVGAAVTDLVAIGDTWEVHTTAGTVPTRFVIAAAGLGAGELARMAGLDGPEIGGRKGEEYLLDKRLRGLVQRVIYPCPTPVSKGTLVIPTYDGTLMVGPTADDVDDLADVATSADGASRVFAAARRLVPVLREADVIAQFAGTRATVAGDDFVIGPTAAPGFLTAAGIQSPGLTAAPAIAVELVGMLAEAGLELEPRPALERIGRPVHFASLTTPEQQALADGDRRYGRIVCRCELVTEAEIVDAVDRGATTLDGLKFRTRAGMGRCQGGFCTARCLELLSTELGVPLADVTKRGPGSWLVIDRVEADTPMGAP